MIGLVYKSTGSFYKIKLENGTFVDCKLSGKFRIQDINSTNPICVGDQVLVDLNETSGNVIKELFERKNYVVRKSVKLSKQFHIIASNINLCFLIVTPKNPETSTMFIDRFLASTISYGIDTLILFNKIDNYDKKSKEIVKNFEEIYTSAGYKTISVSGKKKINIDENPQAPANFGIRSIPTIMLFKNGSVADTKIGLSSEEDLKNWVSNHL